MVVMLRRFALLAAIMLGTAGASDLHAQYFGQNKVQYDTFEFEVLETPHFLIYYYENEASAAAEVARMAERWYQRLSTVLQHDLRGQQHVILYADHPDFRQTNAIEGQIGEGTGGVTEALKRRIVLPLAGPLAETDHVLGHELVHAFQFDITTQGSGSSVFELPGALRLPLWFMEGMAEYLSVGSDDPHTAMWIRDALINDSLPTIRDLDNPDFFPYRYGEALWAYIAGRYGDFVIGDILKSAGLSGNPGTAFSQVLGASAQSLSEEWHQSIRDDYQPLLETMEPLEGIGRRIFTDNAGDVNVSPALSPDGTRVVFFSERDLFAIDMYVADVATGQVLGKITDTATDPHVESLQFISSTGSWSPDGRQFAHGTIVAGRPRLALVDMSSRRRLREFELPGVGEIFNTTWDPSGELIAFAAIADGFSDLFLLDTRDGSLLRLTDDPFAALHPAWSPDGETIAFVTDRFTSDLDTLSFGEYQIGLLDVDTLEIRPAPGTPAPGKHVNPQWSPNGDRIYYLGDASGATNLYSLDMATGARTALSNVATGVSGITALSPAISIAEGDRAVASIFDDGNYRLYEIETDARSRDLAADGERGLLSPLNRRADTVSTYLSNREAGLPVPMEYPTRDYSASLSLDYVAPPTVGVGTSSFGTFVGGGTGLYWSDILGDHNLMTAVELNSTGGNILRDLTSVVGYENRKHRWDWGGVFGQVPFRSGFLSYTPTPTTVSETETLYWQIQRDLIGTLVYPFNRAHRFEFSAGFRNISFEGEETIRVYDRFTGNLIAVTQQDIPSQASLRMGVSSAAFVYDTSISAGLGPILGQRYRVEGGTSVGTLSYTTALGDYRRYFMPLRPITLAFRALHYGRYGGGAEDPRLQLLFIGDQMLVRGYDVNSFSASECGSGGGCPVFDRLIGSRLGIANFEARAPLFGPLGLVSQSFLPVEIGVFVDAGTAWLHGESPDWAGGDRETVTSHGATLRINLLGFAIGQVDLVHPNNRPQRDWLWQFGLTQSF